MKVENIQVANEILAKITNSQKVLDLINRCDDISENADIAIGIGPTKTQGNYKILADYQNDKEVFLNILSAAKEHQTKLRDKLLKQFDEL